MSFSCVFLSPPSLTGPVPMAEVAAASLRVMSWPPMRCGTRFFAFSATASSSPGQVIPLIATVTVTATHTATWRTAKQDAYTTALTSMWRPIVDDSLLVDVFASPGSCTPACCRTRAHSWTRSWSWRASRPCGPIRGEILCCICGRDRAQGSAERDVFPPSPPLAGRRRGSPRGQD